MHFILAYCVFIKQTFIAISINVTVAKNFLKEKPKREICVLTLFICDYLWIFVPDSTVSES